MPASRWTPTVLLALAIAVVLRTAALDASGFTLDEAYSVSVASDLNDLARSRAEDNHPYLWYLFLAAWMSLVGDGDLAVRASSVLGGLAFVVVSALATRRLAGPAAGSWAALFAAAWPLAIEVQRTARMYAWLPTLVAAAVLAILVALDRDRRRWWWLAGASLAALASVHHFGLVVAASLLAGAAMTARSSRGPLWAAAVAALLAAPALGLLGGMLARYAGSSSLGLGIGSFVQLAAGITVGTARIEPALAIIAAAAVAVPSLIGLIGLAGSPRALLLFPLVVGVGIPALVAAVRYPFPLAPQYFVATVPFLIVGAASAAAGSGLTKASARIALAILAVAAVTTIGTEGARREPWRELADLVERSTTVERSVAVAPGYFARPFARYYRGGLPIVTLDVPSEVGRPIASDDVIERLGATEGWILLPDSLASDPRLRSIVLDRMQEVPTGWWMRAFFRTSCCFRGSR